jgi:L-asparaginase/Glu-tRNA(Gln) amidotransferase subunit D
MHATAEIIKPPKPTIDVVYAGGTISSLATPEGYREGGHVTDLLGPLEQHKPGFQDTLTIGQTAVAYSGLSENIDEQELRNIEHVVTEALGHGPYSVVLTHGTDSMEQTGRSLRARLIERLRTRNQRIILTGANDDVSTPDTDVWDNLGFTFDCAASDIEPGVYIAFHDKLIPADLAVKEPFNGVAMNFASRDDPAYQEAVRRQQAEAQRLIGQLAAVYGRQPEALPDIVDYRVNFIRNNHRELLDYTDTHDVRAVLLTLYHSGTANTANSELSVAELAKKLNREKGIVLFGVTENGEPVNFGAYETSVKLKEAGIVPLGDMLHDVALAKLRLINPKVTTDELKQEMQK